MDRRAALLSHVRLALRELGLTKADREQVVGMAVHLADLRAAMKRPTTRSKP